MAADGDGPLDGRGIAAPTFIGPDIRGFDSRRRVGLGPPGPGYMEPTGFT